MVPYERIGYGTREEDDEVGQTVVLVCRLLTVSVGIVWKCLWCVDQN